MTTATKARGLAPKTDDDDEAQEEAMLAGHLSQTFCVTCSFCGELTCSPAAVGQAADYNDRFDVGRLVGCKGLGVRTETIRSRKLRPACPTCLSASPGPIRNRSC